MFMEEVDSVIPIRNASKGIYINFTGVKKRFWSFCKLKINLFQLYLILYCLGDFIFWGGVVLMISGF